MAISHSLAKAAGRLSSFLGGPQVEPRKGTTVIQNPRRISGGDGVVERDRSVSLNARAYRALAEKDDIIVAIRRTLRFAIGELPWKIVPDLDAVKGELKAWQTIIELNLALPGMHIPFRPSVLSMEFYTDAAGALKSILQDEFASAQESDSDDSLENNARIRGFFENCLSIHNVEAEQHATRVHELFMTPEPSNPSSSWRAFSDKLIDDLTLFDAAAYVKNPLRNGGGIGELYALPGPEIRMYRCMDKSTPIPPAICFDQHIDGQIRAIYNSLELGYCMANPQHDGYGKSPIESVLDLMMMSLFGDGYTMAFFSNNNAPRGIFDLGPNVDQGERDATEERWNNLVRQGIRRIMFLSNVEGVKGFIPVPPDSTNKDSEINTLQQTWAKRKCAVYGLSLGDIGWTEDLHRTTAETSHASAQSRGINSFAKVIEANINLSIVKGMMWVRDDPTDPVNLMGQAVPIFPYRDVKFAYQYDDPTGIDADAGPQTQLLAAGVLSINEIRKHRGEPPIPGGDTHFMTGANLIKVADLKHLPPPAAPGGDPGGAPGGAPPGPGVPAGPGGPPALKGMEKADDRLEALAKRFHQLVVDKE